MEGSHIIWIIVLVGMGFWFWGYRTGYRDGFKDGENNEKYSGYEPPHR